MPGRRVAKRNLQIARLLRGTMDGLQMKGTDLAREVEEPYHVVAALVRGDTQRMVPEVANKVCRRLGIRIEVFLQTAGYDIAVTPQKTVPDSFAETWVSMSEDSRKLVGSYPLDTPTLPG